MGQQLVDYIELKGIAEKFNCVAKSITEEEIKKIILDSLKRKIDEGVGTLDFFDLQELGDEWIFKNTNKIEDMISESLRKRLTL